MTVNGVSYDDAAAVVDPGAVDEAGRDPGAFDPSVLVTGLSPAQLLAAQTAIEEHLTAHASALLSGESDDALLGLLDVREQCHRRAEVFDAALYIELSDRGAHRRPDTSRPISSTPTAPASVWPWRDALEALCDWALALAGQAAPERIPSQVVEPDPPQVRPVS